MMPAVRRLLPMLLVLAAPAAAHAADEEKPVLVLDAGGHTAVVSEVLFTPDGKELVTVSEDKTIRTWDVRSGEPLRVLRTPIGPDKDGRLYAAALSPEGRTLAVAGYGWAAGDDPIYLISLADGRIERVLRGHRRAIFALAFAADGRRLASGSGDKTARVWDAATGRCERVLSGHTGDVYGVAFSPDGARLATASYDHTGRIWSVATGRTEAVLRGHEKEVHCVAWRPDGLAVATGSYDRSIRQWGADGATYKGFDGLPNQVLSLAFTGDSRSLLYSWGGGSTTSIGAAVLDLAAGRERVRFTKHTNSVMAGALSPDGALAATAGGQDRETFLWKVSDGAAVHRLAGRGRVNWSAGWSPDGSAIAWGTTNQARSLELDALERTFRLAELEPAAAPDDTYRRARTDLGSLALRSSGRTTVDVRRGDAVVCTLKMTDPYDTVRCFTLLPGDRAAVGSNFGFSLYDARSGALVRSFRGHTGVVWAVAPSPDGRLLLSASGDETLRVWDPGRDDPLVSLFFAGDDWVAWTPEGYYAASPGGENLVGWHVNDGRDHMARFYPTAQFRKSLYRPDVVKLVTTTRSTERALDVSDRAAGKATGPIQVAEVLPPEVEVASPRTGARLRSAKLEVRAIARGRGGRPVTALRLLLDGRPYRGQAGVKAVDPPRSGEVRESWQVELEPGKHTLSVQADGEASQAVSEPVEVTYEAAAEPVELPVLYVLAVGVSAYPGDLRLNYAARDAEAIARTFRGGSAPLFRKVEVKLLTDAAATRSAVLKGLSWLRQQMTQRDVGVVFYSGHGQRDAEGSLYLLPVDVDVEDLLSTAVADVQLKKMLAGMPGRVIALLDACHAGAVEGDRRKAPGGLTDDLVRDLVTDDYGVIVMASSMGREFSLENNAHRQGAFTVALTEGLAGKADVNRDGVVYLNELDTYVTDRVKALSRGEQHPVTAKPASIRSFPLAKP